MAGKGRGGAERWRERLARWRASGLSVAEFCRLHDLCSPAFYMWRKRLKGGRGMRGTRNEAAPRLLPVQVVDSTGTLSMAAGRAIGGGGNVEIALPREVTVRIGTDVDELRLRSVLRAVVAETSGC